MATKRTEKAQGFAAHFLQMLHHLGWSLSALGDPMALRGGIECRTAPLPNGRVLLLLSLSEPLPRLDEAFKHYEDLLTIHRVIQRVIGETDLQARHALLLDERGSAHLIDLAQEEVLVEAAGEEDIVERLLPVLTPQALAKGSLNGLPRKLLRQRARELHEWTKVWSSRIGAAAHTSRDMTTQFFFWLHLSRLAESLGFGPRRKTGYAQYAVEKKPPQPTRFLNQLFRPLNEQWNLLQGASLDHIMQVAERAQQGGQLAPCLDSFSRISSGKFNAPVFAEAFADEELRLVSWRSSITEADEPPADDPASWITNGVSVDLDTTGFTVLLRKFDRIVEDLRRLSREQAVQRERGVRTGLQLDLLGPELPTLREEDTPGTVLELVLKVTTARRDRAELARVVLLAHAAEWHARLRNPEPLFPTPNVTSTESPSGSAPPPRPSARDAGFN